MVATTTEATGSVSEMIRRQGIEALRNTPIRDSGLVLYVSEELIDKLKAEYALDGDPDAFGAFRERLYGSETPGGEVQWIYPRVAFLDPSEPTDGSLAQFIAENGVQALLDVPLDVNGQQRYLSSREIEQILQRSAQDGDILGQNAWKDALWVTPSPDESGAGLWAHPNHIAFNPSEQALERPRSERG